MSFSLLIILSLPMLIAYQRKLVWFASLLFSLTLPSTCLETASFILPNVAWQTTNLNSWALHYLFMYYSLFILFTLLSRVKSG